MSIKELYELLGNTISKNPECAELPVNISTNNCCGECMGINYWLTDCNLHSTGNSGYEECGELTLEAVGIYL